MRPALWFFSSDCKTCNCRAKCKKYDQQSSIEETLQELERPVASDAESSVGHDGNNSALPLTVYLNTDAMHQYFGGACMCTAFLLTKAFHKEKYVVCWPVDRYKSFLVSEWHHFPHAGQHNCVLMCKACEPGVSQSLSMLMLLTAREVTQGQVFIHACVLDLFTDFWMQAYDHSRSSTATPMQSPPDVNMATPGSAAHRGEADQTGCGLGANIDVLVCRAEWYYHIGAYQVPKASLQQGVHCFC